MTITKKGPPTHYVNELAPFKIPHILLIPHLQEILPPPYMECVSQKIKRLKSLIVQTFKPDIGLA
jgi:hypothetical protein